MDIIKSMDYALEKHSLQNRKDGSPYAVHIIAVAKYLFDKGYGDEYVITGLFHDLLEDTDATESEILALSSPDVLQAVRLLTKGEDMESYIAGILANPIARAVKDADRINNLMDALDAKVSFARGYLKNTDRWFKGRFSKELDDICERLRAQIADYHYTIDASMGNYSPLYRTTSDGKSAWIFNREIDWWKPADPYFWAALEDNAMEISEAKAQEIFNTSI